MIHAKHGAVAVSAHELYVGLAAVGGLLLVLGMLAGLIHEKGTLSEPLFALLVVAVLLPRRLPTVLAVRPLLGELRGTKDLHFLGWFGPIGAAALYYSTFSLRETGIEEMWWAGSLVIVASVVAHGITDTPLTKLYGKRASQA